MKSTESYIHIKKRPLYRRALSVGFQTVKKLPELPFFLSSLPFTVFFIFLFPWVKIKFVRLCSDRIGHYALNTELLLAYLDQKKLTEKHTRYFFYRISGPISNTQLDAMWKRVIRILPFSKLISHIDKNLLTVFGFRYKEHDLKIFETALGACDRFNTLKKNKTPFLSFTPKEIEEAHFQMKRLGIEENARYICLAIRDSVYLKQLYPKKNWSYHNHRDADIQTYKKAAIYLAEKGYTVLRMGKHVDKAFDVQHPNIIDYATHPLRSDFMDVFLCATCVFCISSGMGLDAIPQIFRKPILLTNMSPIIGQLPLSYPYTLFIPKLLKSKCTNAFLTATEMKEVLCSISHDALAEFAQRDLLLVANTDEQLLEVVQQMEAKLVGTEKETKIEKTQQEQYWKLFREKYPVPVNEIYINIGSRFLAENSILLQ